MFLKTAHLLLGEPTVLLVIVSTLMYTRTRSVAMHVVTLNILFIVLILNSRSYYAQLQ